MTESQADTTAADAPAGTQLLGTLTFLDGALDGAAAGYCSNGVCHFPAPKTQ